jgi:serine/threonine protein kinase
LDEEDGVMKKAGFSLQAKLIFLRCIELPPPDRSAFLEQACAGNRALLEETRILLENHDSNDGFMELSLMDLSGKREEAPPETIGRYRVLEELGRGAMGIVYRARDERIGRDVAVKVLRHDCGSGKALKRFAREARAAGRLNHPRIVNLHDFGFRDGRPYLVMALLAGKDLRKVMAEKGDIPLDRIVHFICSICEGLAHARDKGIVHRDIKPENVFIGPDDSVTILDFGVARLLEDGGKTSETGTFFGTPHYASPEQVAGGRADHRSDLFSTGVILYELLTGRRPFEGSGLSTLLFNIAYSNPPTLEELGSRHPPVLDKILQRCLAKPPGCRYQLAEDLAADLRCSAQGRPVAEETRSFSDPSESSALSRQGTDPAGGARSPLPRAPGRRSWKRTVGAYLALAFAIPLATVLAWSVIRRYHAPAEVVFRPKGFLVKDSWGLPLFSRTLEAEIAPEATLNAFLDLDGDKIDDVIIGVTYDWRKSRAKSELLLFKNYGKEIASLTVEKPLTVGDHQYDDAYYFKKVMGINDPKGQPRILVVANHKTFSPSLAWLIDNQGNKLGEFINQGALQDAILWNADADDDKEIVLSGGNNAYHAPILAVLDFDRFGGASPPVQSDDPWANLCSPGLPLMYVGFKPLGVEFGTSPLDFVDHLAVVEHELFADVRDKPNILQYRIGRGFQTIDAVILDETVERLTQNPNNRLDLQAVRELEKEFRAGVRFLPGQDWTLDPVTSPER